MMQYSEYRKKRWFHKNPFWRYIQKQWKKHVDNRKMNCSDQQVQYSQSQDLIEPGSFIPQRQFTVDLNRESEEDQIRQLSQIELLAISDNQNRQYSEIRQEQFDETQNVHWVYNQLLPRIEELHISDDHIRQCSQNPQMQFAINGYRQFPDNGNGQFPVNPNGESAEDGQLYQNQQLQISENQTSQFSEDQRRQYSQNQQIQFPDDPNNQILQGQFQVNQYGRCTSNQNEDVAKIRRLKILLNNRIRQFEQNRQLTFLQTNSREFSDHQIEEWTNIEQLQFLLHKHITQYSQNQFQSSETRIKQYKPKQRKLILKYRELKSKLLKKQSSDGSGFQQSPDFRPRASSNTSSCGRLSPIPSVAELESEWGSPKYNTNYSPEIGNNYSPDTLAGNLQQTMKLDADYIGYMNGHTPTQPQPPPPPYTAPFDNFPGRTLHATSPYGVTLCPVHRTQNCICMSIKVERMSPTGMSPSYPHSEPSPDPLGSQYMLNRNMIQRPPSQSPPLTPQTPQPAIASTMMGQLMGALNQNQLDDLSIMDLHGSFDCNVEELIKHELNMDGSLEFNFQNQPQGVPLSQDNQSVLPPSQANGPPSYSATVTAVTTPSWVH